MWEKIRGSNTSRGRSGAYQLRIARHSTKNNKCRLSVTVHAELMSELKWQPGDRIVVLIDRQFRLIGFRRAAEDEHGWTLSATENTPQTRKTSSVRFGVKDRGQQFLLGDVRTISRDEIVIDDGIVVIEMPPEKTAH